VWLSFVDGSFLDFFGPGPTHALSLMVMLTWMFLSGPGGSPGPPEWLGLDEWMAALALAALSSTNNASANTPATDAKKGSEGAWAFPDVCAQDGVFWEDGGGGAGGGPKNIVRAVSALFVSVEVREEVVAVPVVDDDVLGRDGSSEHSFATNDAPSLSTHLQIPSARSFQTRQLKQGPGIILRASSACSYRRMRRRGANGR
jgi:hypothetical protein